MNRIRDCTTLALILLAFCGMPRIVAQEPSPTPTVLTIHPAGEPRPALRYSLVPEQRDLVPGNAAIFYHRACLMVATASRDNKEEEKASAWLSGPLG